MEFSSSLKSTVNMLVVQSSACRLPDRGMGRGNVLCVAISAQKMKCNWTTHLPTSCSQLPQAASG